MNYGDRLRLARTTAGLSQDDLAALTVGRVKQGTISKIERGDQNRSSFDVDLGMVLNVHPKWLKDGSDEYAPDWIKNDYDGFQQIDNKSDVLKNKHESLVVSYRRANLRRFILNNFNGNNQQAEFVRKYDLNQGDISALLRAKPFGEKKARLLEKKIGLAPFDLDKKTDNNFTESPKSALTQNIASFLDIPINLRMEIYRSITPNTIEQAFRLKSSNLVTAIYRLINLYKEPNRLLVLKEIDALIQYEIDAEKENAKPSPAKTK